MKSDLKAKIDAVDELLAEIDDGLLNHSLLRCKIACDNMAAAPNFHKPAEVGYALAIEIGEHRERHECGELDGICYKSDHEDCRELRRRMLEMNGLSEWLVRCQNELENNPTSEPEKTNVFESFRFYLTYNNLEVLLAMPIDDWPKKLVERYGVPELRQRWLHWSHPDRGRAWYYEALGPDISIEEEVCISDWLGRVHAEVDNDGSEPDSF